MRKTKVYDLDVQKMAEKSETKQTQTIIDWAFGLNNAFLFWESNDHVDFVFRWDGQESKGTAQGEQWLDVVIGLITKYDWQNYKGILHAEISWGKDE